MAPRKVQISLSTSPPEAAVFDCTLYISAYTAPFSDPPRLSVRLHTDDHRRAPHLAELSVNLPDVPPPPARSFYFKTWSGNEGLMDQLEAQGVIEVPDRVRGAVPVKQHGGKAVECRLLWPDSDMAVDIADADTRRRDADDHERFMSNTYSMHLGM